MSTMVTSSLHIAALYSCPLNIGIFQTLKIAIWGMRLWLRESLPSMDEAWILIHKLTHMKTKVTATYYSYKQSDVT